MTVYNRLENGDYDRLVIDPNGVVEIEYIQGACLKHEQVRLCGGATLMVGGTTAICDRRRKYETTRYRLKHK